MAAVDVYVDDFLLMAQTAHQQRKVLRAALQAVDAVFRPLDATDPAHRKEPASVKKMLKGDAHWATQKRILGWDFDTHTETMHLPPHRVARLYAILTELQPPRKRMLTTRWHQILGELRSMSPALPGTKGLFSVLQATLSRGDRHRVRLNQHVYNTASDFRALVDSVATRPTRLRELVPTAPSDIGACDACRTGMGGVWFDAVDPSSAPVLWRHRFPAHIAASLITADHPSGSLSISDLELAGVVAHKAVLASIRDVAERTVWIASDNQAAVAWSNKGSATSLAARAHLLRYTALHQRRHRYVTRNHYIPGPVNVMADDASRLWHLSDAALLTHFDTVYPQAASWCMQTLPPATSAIVIGALSNIPQPCAALLSEVPTQPPHGTSGRPSVPVSVSMSTTSPPSTPSLSSCCSPSVTAPAPSPPAVDRCGLAQWRMPYDRLARRTPGWGPLTLA